MARDSCQAHLGTNRALSCAVCMVGVTNALELDAVQTRLTVNAPGATSKTRVPANGRLDIDVVRPFASVLAYM